MQQSEDELEHPAASDIAMAHPNASIEDAGEALARSVANLAIDASGEPEADDAIDQLTEQFTAFCFEHLEKRIDQRQPEGNLDMNIDGEAFKNELSVRDALPWDIYDRI